jgi:replicative DNA helicase
VSEISKLVYTPQEAASLTAQMVRGMQEHLTDGITTGISGLDSFMLPFGAGDLVTIIGYTSHGKTSWMNFLIRNALAQIKPGECIVKCTWEQSVEQDTLYWIANDAHMSISTMVRGNFNEAAWKIFMHSYQKRVSVPLFIVGHSSVESAGQKKIRPRLTMANVTEACEYIMNSVTDQKYKIKMVALDYLQRIRPDPRDGQDRRIQMIEAVNRSKDLGVGLGCPVLLNVQARREVNDRQYKQPNIDDGQETSNIEQSSDFAMSLWYPIKTEKPGSILSGITVDESYMSLTLLKQKFGKAPVTIPLNFKPAECHFSDYNTILP